MLVQGGHNVTLLKNSLASMGIRLPFLRLQTQDLSSCQAFLQQFSLNCCKDSVRRLSVHQHQPTCIVFLLSLVYLDVLGKEWPGENRLNQECLTSQFPLV